MNSFIKSSLFIFTINYGVNLESTAYYTSTYQDVTTANDVLNRPNINGGTFSGPEISNVPINQSKFERLDKTNCVYGRIPAPGTSGTNYKYLGIFDTYDQCATSPNIDSNTKAITHYGTNSGGFSKQCFSINDNMILGISSCIKFIFYIFKSLND